MSCLNQLNILVQTPIVLKNDQEVSRDLAQQQKLVLHFQFLALHKVLHYRMFLSLF